MRTAAALALILLLAGPSAAQERPAGWAGLAFGPAPEGGTRVLRLTPDSPAAKAGLRAGDRIALVGAQETSPDALNAALRKTGPGQALELLARTGAAAPRKVTLLLEAFDLPGLSDRALRLGAEALVGQQLDSGGWRRKGAAEELGADASLTSLCVRALLALPEDRRATHSDAIERGVGFLLEHQDPSGAIVASHRWVHYRTYTSALTLQSLCLLKRTGPERKRLEAWFVEAQLDDGEEVSEYEFDRYGGWNTWDENRPATMATDISVTSFAIEALALSSSLEGTTRDQALLLLTRTQNLPREDRAEDPLLDGGFTNSPQASKAGQEVRSDGSVVYRSYGSPTADGVRSLLRLGVPRDDPRVAAGVAWIAEHFALRENPNFPQELEPVRRGIYYYYLHAVSDALALHGAPNLHAAQLVFPWAPLLAKQVVVLQRADGTWQGEHPLLKEDDPCLASSWALMALARCRPFLGGD